MPEFVCRYCKFTSDSETRIIKPGAVFTGNFLVKDIGAPYPKKKGISYGSRKRTRHLIPVSTDLVSALTEIVPVSTVPVPPLIRPQVIALPWKVIGGMS